MNDALDRLGHLAAVGVEVAAHVEVAEGLERGAPLDQLQHRLRDIGQIAPLVADTGQPGLGQQIEVHADGTVVIAPDAEGAPGPADPAAR